MYECYELGMIDFMNQSVAARVFTSKRSAEVWVMGKRKSDMVPDGIELRIISDEAWDFARITYFKSKYREEE